MSVQDLANVASPSVFSILHIQLSYGNHRASTAFIFTCIRFHNKTPTAKTGSSLQAKQLIEMKKYYCSGTCHTILGKKEEEMRGVLRISNIVIYILICVDQ